MYDVDYESDERRQFRPLGHAALTALTLLLLAGFALASLGTAGKPWRESSVPASGNISSDWLNVVFTAAVLAVTLGGAVVLLSLGTGLKLRHQQGAGGKHELRLLLLLGRLFLLLMLPVTVLVLFLRGSPDAPFHVLFPTSPPSGADRGGPELGSRIGLDWPILAGFVVMLALLPAGAMIWRRLRSQPRAKAETPLALELSAVLDESLDDLEAEPDCRRAVIRAYARMELMLSRRGLPRRSAEAPGEYLQRAVGNLAVERDDLSRLTELFSQARFSTLVIDPTMKNAALGALRRLRAGLGAP